MKRAPSLTEQAMLDAEQMRPGMLSERATISIAVQVHGEIDLERLARAYDRLVSRHEILRSRLVGGEAAHVEVLPHRRVTPELVPDVTFFSRLDATAIDPHAPPLVRCFVAPGQGKIGLVFSHVIMDPTGARLALQELAGLYEGDMPPAPQYRDYALWEAERRAYRGESDRAAWLRILADVKPARYVRQVPFVVGRKAAPVVTTLPLLDKKEVDALGRWSWRQRSTLSITLMAAFARAIREDADRDDLVISTVFERRDSVPSRSMLGNFLHGVPVRVRVPEGEPMPPLVERTRSAVLEAHEHAIVPLRVFAERMPRFLPGALGLMPSWVRFFQFVPRDQASYCFGDAEATVVYTGGGGDPQDLLGLHLGVYIAEDGSLHGRLSYDTHDLDAENALRIVDDFCDRAREVLR